MAFPTIPTSGAGRIVSNPNTSPAGTHTFSWTGLTKNAGDLIIAVVITYDGNSTNAEFSSWGGSFNEFVDQATTATMGIGAAWKIATGSESGTFTVTSADTSANDSVCILMSIAGAHASTPPEGGTIANGTGAAANINSLNPSGWDVEDTLWSAVCGAGEDSTTGSFTAPSAAPSNYGNLFATAVTADVVGGVYGALAFRQLAAASDDPATFTVDTSNARNSALLIAVRPAAVTNASAENVAITATSEAAAASVAPNAQDVAITSTAETPTASVGPNAEGVAVTAEALDATVETVGGTNAEAECAEATGTAEAASAAVDVQAEGVAVTATAEDVTASVGANAEATEATATAETPTTSVTLYAESVTVTAAAESASAAVAVNAEGVAVGAAALDATVETTGATNASAECAEATGEALTASTHLSVSSETAVSSAAVDNALAAVEVLAEAASIIAAAFDATVEIGGATTAQAECATAVGQAFDAQIRTQRPPPPSQMVGAEPIGHTARVAPVGHLPEAAAVTSATNTVPRVTQRSGVS